jgi:hypothetical protein
MKSKFIPYLLATILLGVLTAFGQTPSTAPPTTEGKPKIALSKMQHEFGEIKKGQLAEYSFTFKNEGAADLLITNVQPGCGCTTSDYTKVVPPGQAGKITLSVHTENFSGVIAKSAQVFTNDPAQPQFNLLLSMNIVVPPVAGPKLGIAQLQHDFGEIKKGTTAQHSFTFKNEGSVDLQITNVAPACGCTSSDFTKIVPPGKEGHITLAVHTDAFTGALSKTAEVFTNDPARPQFTLTMSMVVTDGNTLPPGKRLGSLIITPVDRWSTQVPKGFPVSGLISLYHDNAQPLTITKMEPGGEAFAVTLNTLEAGKRFTVNFVAKEGLPIGAYHQTIKLKTDSPETPELSLELDLRVVAPVSANPAKIVFENLPVSLPDYDISTLSKFTWVTVTRSGGLELNKISSDLPFLKIKVESVEPNKQTYLLRIGFNEKPAKGKHQGLIKIETNHKDMPVIEIPVTITAN